MNDENTPRLPQREPRGGTTVEQQLDELQRRVTALEQRDKETAEMWAEAYGLPPE